MQVAGEVWMLIPWPALQALTQHPVTGLNKTLYYWIFSVIKALNTLAVSTPASWTGLGIIKVNNIFGVEVAILIPKL